MQTKNLVKLNYALKSISLDESDKSMSYKGKSIQLESVSVRNLSISEPPSFSKQQQTKKRVKPTTLRLKLKKQIDTQQIKSAKYIPKQRRNKQVAPVKYVHDSRTRNRPCKFDMYKPINCKKSEDGTLIVIIGTEILQIDINDED